MQHCLKFGKSEVVGSLNLPFRDALKSSTIDFCEICPAVCRKPYDSGCDRRKAKAKVGTSVEEQKELH